MPDVTVSTDIDALLKSADDTAARAELGVAIGTDVQAHSAALDAVTGTNTGDQDLSGLQPKPAEGQFVDGDKTKLDSISGSPITTKGDLYTFDTDEQRLPIGADNTHLVADSAELTGLKWVVSQNNNSVNSTGLLTGGVLSTGGGATEYSISDGTGQIVTQIGDKTEISWTGKSNITPTNIATQLITFVGLDVNGDVVEQSSPFTSLQSRSIIILGVVVHVDNINVDAVNVEAHPSYNVMSQLTDLGDAIGFFNQKGNLIQANGANLNIDKTSGTIFKMGSNYDIEPNAPHSKSLGSITAASFQYRFSNGTNGTTGTNIDPDNVEDNAGNLVALANNRWSVQRVYSFISNNVKIQRGVTSYVSKADAINGISTEPYITEPSIAANALLRGWIVVQEGATDLSDTAQAEFLEAPKFGSGGGSAGAASSVADDTPYGVSWDGNTDAATKNALYDKIETIGGGGGGGTVQGTDGTYDIQPTNEGSTAGNARGENSVDLQTKRNVATQVASGLNSVIAGGGLNTASSSYGVIGGGRNNTISGNPYNAILSGNSNLCTISSYYAGSVIAGGTNNQDTSSGNYSGENFIGGGVNHTISGNYASWNTLAGGQGNSITGAGAAFVGGGWGNTVSAYAGMVVGGSQNTASGSYSAILGGNINNTNSVAYAMIVGSGITATDANTLHCNNLKIEDGGFKMATGATDTYVLTTDATGVGTWQAAGGGGGTVQGTDGTYDIQPTNEGSTAGNSRGESSVDLQTKRGAATQVASGANSAIGGGKNNTASGGYSTVSGGEGNSATQMRATVSGGYQNTASGYYATITGGFVNTASAYYAFVGNGTNNTASGEKSAILGGSNNSTNNLTEAMIVGSEIIAQRANTLHCNNLTIKNIPTSSAGLTAGDVWNDAGTLKIV